jgi:ABC-type antimicrobial peptide transport system permease subunit
LRTPDWWSATLLALAAWRTFHLLAFDDILDRPRRYITRLSPKWKEEGDATGEDYREGVANFLTCPFCMGWWIGLAWWGAWLAFPTASVGIAFGFAISAGVIGAQRMLSAE